MPVAERSRSWPPLPPAALGTSVALLPRVAATSDGRETRKDARLAAVVLVAYVASTIWRFWFVLVFHHPRHHVTSDAAALLALSEKLIASPSAQAVSDTIWPPGTSSVLGLFMALDGTLGLAAFVQALLGALVPLLVAHTTYVAIGRRAALIALGFASLHFGFIYYGGFFLSEQLFQFAVAVAVWASVVALHHVAALESQASADRDRRELAFVRLAFVGAACGAAWAVATSFRPNALPVALVVGLALAAQALRRRSWPRLQMLGAGFLAFVLCLAPLAVRCTTLKGGGFCPLSSNLAMNIALGQSGELTGLTFVSGAPDQPTTDWVPPALMQHGYKGMGTVPTSIYDTAGVLRWVAGRFAAEPATFLLRAVGNALDLFRLEYWPDDRESGERLVTVVKQVFLLAVIAPALVALAGAARSARRARRLPPLWCFLITVVAAVLGTAALSMGEARYRLPFDGVLIVCAASLIAGGPDERPTTARGPGWSFGIVGAATVACVALVAVASFPRGHALAALERFAGRWSSSSANATRRLAADFSTPRAPESAWDAAGNHIFECAPGCTELRLTYPERQHAKSVELSLDNNDRYRVVFYRDEHALADVNVDARPEAPGLRVETSVVPALVAAEGFDSIGVRPLYGDGSYALGHVRLLDGP
jgi:hypothetical protein